MQLLIDFGNSRLKWASWENGALHYGGEALHREQELEGLFASWWQDLSPPRAVLCASVSDAANDARLAQWCEQHWQRPVHWLQAVEKQLGVRNAYTDAQTLGSDRWAALLGAHGASSHHVGIIDCGSALTVDLLRADGTHDGGYILPGLRMMQQCLLERTGRVVAEPLMAEQMTPGQSTRECLAHGALRSVTALLDRLMTELPARYDNGLEWLLTGGDAPHIRPHLREACRLVPDLVLQGLARVAQGNE